MSNTLLNHLRPAKMKPTDKAVLMCMADLARDDGSVWYSIDSLSEFTCFSKRAVIDAIKALEDGGFLVVDRGNGRRSTYTVIAVDLSKPVQMAHRCRKVTGADAAPEPVQMAHQPVQMAPKAVQMAHPIHKNHKEPSVTHKETRLPKDWVPSVEEIEFCQARRPDLDAESTAESFRDYWTALPAGKKSMKSDWTATWRNWVKSQKQSFQKPSGETAYQESMRKKMEVFAPSVAAKAPGRTIDLNIFEKPVLLERA